jgi:hypothetical protein
LRIQGFTIQILTLRLQAGTANQESVNISLLAKLLAVLCIHATSVKDTRGIRSFGRDILLDPVTDGGVDFLGLLCGSDLAGADGPVVCLALRCVGKKNFLPNRLVSNDDLAPVFHNSCDCGELFSDNLDGLIGLSLLHTSN